MRSPYDLTTEWLFCQNIMPNLSPSEARMTPIHLTEEQRRLVEAEQGRPVDVLDPSTNRTYVLIAREQFVRMQELLNRPRQSPLVAEGGTGVSPGVLRSQEAYWRDLPDLLKLKSPEW